MRASRLFHELHLACGDGSYFVRLARSLSLTIRENDYIMAARAIGAGQLQLIAHHVFPNALYALVVVATLYIATAIRTEGEPRR